MISNFTMGKCTVQKLKAEYVVLDAFDNKLLFANKTFICRDKYFCALNLIGRHALYKENKM